MATRTGSPSKKFEIEHLVNTGIDSKMGEIAGKLKEFETQIHERFKQLEASATSTTHRQQQVEAALTQVEAAISQAETRFNAVLARVGEIMGASEKSAREHDEHLRATIDSASATAAHLGGRVEHMERVIGGADRRHREDLGAIQQFVADSRSQLDAHARQTLENFNILAMRMRDDMSSMPAAVG